MHLRPFETRRRFLGQRPTGHGTSRCGTPGRKTSRRGFLTALLSCALACNASAADESPEWNAIDAEFPRVVRPVLQAYCLDCHSGEQAAGDLDLARFDALAEVRTAIPVWVKVAEQLAGGEMPPEDQPQPSAAEQHAVRDWVDRYLKAEAVAQAGDPGPVYLRRLNNVEFTWTLRDLTGVAMDPAREFPGESAAGEGFTNASSGQSMSPALLAKYLDAGKQIAGRAVLLPDGFRFSASDAPLDWTEELVSEIQRFYRRHVGTTELGVGTSVGVVNIHGNASMGILGHLPWDQYLAATIAERESLRRGVQSVANVAATRGLNAKYLEHLWLSLSASEPSFLLDDLRRRWQTATLDDVPHLTASISAWQRGLWVFNSVSHLGRKGSRARWMEPESPIVARHEMRLSFPPLDASASNAATVVDAAASPPAESPADAERPEAAGSPLGAPSPVPADEDVVFTLVSTDAGDGNAHDDVIWRAARLVAKDQPDLPLSSIAQLRGIARERFGKRANGESIEENSFSVRAPEAITLRIPRSIAAGKEFVVSAELDPDTGREGSAQVDVVAGVAAAPAGLAPSVITVTLSQVTALYPDERKVSFQRPLLLAADTPHRTVWESAFESHRRLFPPSLCYPQVVPRDELLTLTQFYRDDEHLKRLLLNDGEARTIDRLWDELLFVSREPIKLAEVLDSLVETLRGHAQMGAFDDVIEPIHQRAASFRRALVDAEPLQLEELIRFAERAYRRPLVDVEIDELRRLYRQLRDEGIEHEEAFRLTLARLFCAAPFLFRIESATPPSSACSGRAPVSDWELASRLSYFLWSSLPDEELRAAASRGELQQTDALQHQTRRMLKDSRIRRFATEFGCQWLQVYDFPLSETKSERLFPEFVRLRDDMYEEVILFVTHLFQDDSSLLDLITADYTYANGPLAEFYGFPDAVAANAIADPGAQAWRRIDGTNAHGRGGILSLAATLAKQAGASRTSPILRGTWISEALLGERLPRPPKDVPQLSDEAPVGLTERQLIERHSSDPACAKCHRRVDPFGFALEEYDAIGRRRAKDAAGRSIDAATALPDGRGICGLAGLRDYLANQRRDSIVRQFCRKLLGYALGRETQLSDAPLLREMESRLAAADYRVTAAVEAVVCSPQFRQKRFDVPSPPLDEAQP